MTNPDISATIILDSVNSATGDRITTFRVEVPKWLLAQVNTHRMLSRSFASTRAISPKKQFKRVFNQPVLPLSFGQQQKGMQAGEELKGWRLWMAEQVWLVSRFPNLASAWILNRALSVHKQTSMRLLEPWVMAEGVITATTFQNFFNLRCDDDAQPELQELALKMRHAYEYGWPDKLNPGDWHLPFIRTEERKLDLDTRKKISAARCARVSYYLPMSDKLSTVESDLRLYNDLVTGGHWSPLEHQAKALPTSERVGNFKGWFQHRKEFANESGEV